MLSFKLRLLVLYAWYVVSSEEVNEEVEMDMLQEDDDGNDEMSELLVEGDAVNDDGEESEFAEDFLEIFEEEDEPTCSACWVTVKKIAARAKVLRKHGVNDENMGQALKDDDEVCEFGGYAFKNRRYDVIERLKDRNIDGSFSFSNLGIESGYNVHSRLLAACNLLIENYGQFIWDARKLANSETPVAKALCINEEKLCPVGYLTQEGTIEETYRNAFGAEIPKVWDDEIMDWIKKHKKKKPKPLDAEFKRDLLDAKQRHNERFSKRRFVEQFLRYLRM